MAKKDEEVVIEEETKEVKEEASEEKTEEVSEESKEETSEDKSKEEASEEKTEETSEDESKEETPEEDKDFEVLRRTHVHKQIGSIQFSILSPRMIKKMASAKVVTPELYDKEGYPVDGGLMDIRLGVIDPGLKCKTCGSKLKECIGHFGYIELARPVVHIKFVPYVQKFLRASCRECGRLVLNKQKIEAYKKQFKKAGEEYSIDAQRAVVKKILASAATQSKCPHCKSKQYKISLEKPSTYLEADRRISPIEVRTRLEKIHEEDLDLLGLNEKIRPEWMILTIMPIPPVTMRPSITLESGERSEDDLTHKLGDIVRINQRLFENINAGAPEIIIEDLWDLLQYHVTTFFDNNISQLPPARHRTGQPLKTITERIKSKEGRIRRNLTGKRTNFCARTVISPDPMLRINEVGVPKVVAMKLTVPEMVTEWNMKYLKKFIENGPDKYPGSNYVVRPDGKKKKITEETKEASLEEIQPGYVVERHLLDGDIALFNRQPSLHRMSMMCHRVRVLPYKTLRLNPSVCHPYNADFDGDEMNLHIPQTEEARAEAEILMQVQTQLISPGYGLSVIGCMQDSISGNFVLTSSKFELPYAEAIDLLVNAGVEDTSRLPEKKTVTGKEIFSVVVPGDFNYNGKSKTGEEVIIKNGLLIKGRMDASNLGGGSGLMLRDIHKKYGADKTVEILQKFFMLGTEVLTRYGFTVSISDTDMPEEAKKIIEKTLVDSESEIKELIKTFHAGKLEPFPGRSPDETLELKILESLNKARNKCGLHVQKYANPDTHTLVMAESGARGKPINLAQMAAVVGQQAMRGNRIEKGYRGRTLSCFKKGDLSPEARGFIRRGFKHGLNPKEFFFGAITGRDSLMDTALRTPKSGYLYRRLANALQDLKVEYDETVRDASGRIIQFQYGEDGIDVSRSEKGKLNVKKIVESI